MMLRKLFFNDCSYKFAQRSSWYQTGFFRILCNFSSSQNFEGDETEESVVKSHEPSTKISIDRTGLYNPQNSFDEASSDSEFVKHLKNVIKFNGPITVAEYMEEVLTNPKHGFYINRDVFGSKGDFITSPEVSQMFGEMIGIWIMCLWEQMGQPSKVNLVEFGPGRGTLMADLLRGTSKFKKFAASLDLHMIECSPALQKIQYNTLKCKEDIEAVPNGRTSSQLTGVSISWHSALDSVPFGLPTIFIAHEFYDALPMHQFQKASSGWREKMIDIAEIPSKGFRFVLSPHLTPASLVHLRKRCSWVSAEEISQLDHIEVCPKAMELTQSISKRISSHGGGALIVDYGMDGIVSNSLQAIREHKFVDILDSPGMCDLSAYVDFASIRQSALDASENVAVHGPMNQAQFLGSLGINFRMDSLLQNATDEQISSLEAGYWRLVGYGKAPFWEGPDHLAPVGMGTRYLVMAITSKELGAPIPFQ